MEAIESVADADHILVMMDMARPAERETALDLLDPAIAAKVACARRRWWKGLWRRR
jgi:PTS hybrid protein